MPTTIRDICSDALHEIQVIAGEETPEAWLAEQTRRQLERLLDEWNATPSAVYATVFSLFTLVPGTSPHTIGPTGATFTVAKRPVSIDGISLVLNTSTPSAYLPLNSRGKDWWQAQIVPGLSTDIPTDFFYNPTSPNGEIYFWPVPDAAYPVQLQIRTLFNDSVTLNDTFDLPQGYQNALTLTLAERCAPANGAAAVAAAELIKNTARHARAVVFANNDVTPRIATRDAGMQGPQGGSRSSFNYLIGSDTV